MEDVARGERAASAVDRVGERVVLLDGMGRGRVEEVETVGLAVAQALNFGEAALEHQGVAHEGLAESHRRPLAVGRDAEQIVTGIGANLATAAVGGALVDAQGQARQIGGQHVDAGEEAEQPKRRPRRDGDARDRWGREPRVLTGDAGLGRGWGARCEPFGGEGLHSVRNPRVS